MERALTVTVVLVTWNSAPWLRRCLEGVKAQTYRDLELIAVDNASTDDSAQLAEAAGFRVIRNETNVGFAAAVNQAVAASKGEYIQLVNPDCYLTPEYIATLVTTLDAKWRKGNPAFPPGAATGKLLKAIGPNIAPTDDIDSLGIRMTRSGRHFDITHYRPPTTDHDVFGVSGAAAMYSRRFLDDTGGFDEDFFAYREDADLAWRGRLLGWRSLCVPTAIAYHVRRVTPEARRTLPAAINMHSVKNRFLLRLKNEGLYLALRNAPFELTRDLIVLLAALTIERSSLPAFGWLWRNRRRILAKRREIQSRRRVSDRELARWFR